MLEDQRPSDVQVHTRWARPPGLLLLGPAQGSGLRQPSFLVQRGDGQVVQVSELLHLVLREIDEDRGPDEIAAVVSSAYGRQLSCDGLDRLIESRLRPAGLVEDSDGPPAAPPPVATPLLSLSMRGTLIPAGIVRRLVRALALLYLPPVVAAAVALLVTLEVLLARDGDLLAALDQLLATPVLLLALFGLLTAGAVVHEIGHATACHYSGGRPGTIGVGVYIVFPAFYTDVTDAYRLSRAGRLRTDLGGLYFNVWCLLALGGAYLATGHGLFLLALLVMQIQMVQQLVPVVRFDGYYILADLAGVPDLFGRVAPVLRSLGRHRPADPRVDELRPFARRLVTTWVLLVVPTLAVAICWMLWTLPIVVERSVRAIGVQGDALVAGWRAADMALVLWSVLSIVFLVLPVMGIAVLLWRLARWSLRFLSRHTDLSSPLKRGQDEEETVMLMKPRHQSLTAAAFTDEEILAPERPAPTIGWQRAVYVASAGAVNPGPGAEERRRRQLTNRLRAPIDGSRRVVVMSRKGGVGKTTIALALGSTFASLRGDRVVAVDANPDAGNLAHRVAPPGSRTITDVLADLERIASYSQLRAYVSQAAESRLEVLASDDDPRIGMALDRDDYHRLIGLLDHFYNLILLDTGTGILDSANQGLLTEAHELVLVLRPGVDGGRAGALTLDWLERHEYGDLVSRAVVVVNAVRPGVGAPLQPIEEHFASRCSRVVTVPWDPVLERGAQTSLSSLRRQTRQALIEMAAAVSDNFARSGAQQ